MLAIFLNGKKCYAATRQTEKTIECGSVRTVSDVLVPMLSEFHEISEVNRVIFPVGPGSFTSIRVVLSVIKGFSIAGASRISLSPVSSFLPFFLALPESVKTGTLAISTGRGDYFCSRFDAFIIENQFSIISSISEIEDIFLDSDEIFSNVNLAGVMLRNIDSPRAIANTRNATSLDEPVYGFSPDYTIKP
jgi:tRNA A37 threonylcarbamoyladenosine modification protein TsaB